MFRGSIEGNVIEERDMIHECRNPAEKGQQNTEESYFNLYRVL